MLVELSSQKTPKRASGRAVESISRAWAVFRNMSIQFLLPMVSSPISQTLYLLRVLLLVVLHVLMLINYADPALSDYWRFYPTPEPAILQPDKTKKRRKQKKWLPLADLEKKTQYYRKAIALDCEMGTSSTLWPEMIRITVVDYFTAEVLMNKVVKPWMPMRNMNTKYGSGVT